jgi:hypothetical protein
MDSVVVYQDSLHLEISLFTILLVLKLYKSVLQTVARSLISDNFAG